MDMKHQQTPTLHPHMKYLLTDHPTQPGNLLTRNPNPLLHSAPYHQRQAIQLQKKLKTHMQLQKNHTHPIPHLLKLVTLPLKTIMKMTHTLNQRRPMNSQRAPSHNQKTPICHQRKAMLHPKTLTQHQNPHILH